MVVLFKIFSVKSFQLNFFVLFHRLCEFFRWFRANSLWNSRFRSHFLISNWNLSIGWFIFLRRFEVSIILISLHCSQRWTLLAYYLYQHKCTHNSIVLFQLRSNLTHYFAVFPMIFVAFTFSSIALLCPVCVCVCSALYLWYAIFRHSEKTGFTVLFKFRVIFRFDCVVRNTKSRNPHNQ